MLHKIAGLGEELSREAQMTIKGGKIDCYYPGTTVCKRCGSICGQLECQDPGCDIGLDD